MKEAAPELNVSSSEAEEEKEETRLEGEQDPDFNQVCLDPFLFGRKCFPSKPFRS